MATATLSATPRSDTGKGAARKLRAAQRLPGVLYGHNRNPLPLALEAREFERLIAQVSADTTVIELTVDGENVRTLIREIQRHPFKPEVLHVDFQALVAGETVTVDIPIVLHGTPAGVRLGGTLDQVMRQLTVEVDPSAIPNHVDLDVSELGLAESIHVRDVKLAQGVEILDDPDATICVVAPPRVAEAEPAAAEEPTGAEPELIRKAKEEEDGEKE
jgi:large subunit ribosomal protein L25